MRLDMAEAAAFGAARISAMRGAVRALAARPDFVYLAGQEGPEAGAPLDPLSLAYALTETSPSAESALNGLPPRMRVTVALASRPASGSLGERILFLLKKPQVLELYTLAAQRDEECLADYDAAAEAAMSPGERPDAHVLENKLLTTARRLKAQQVYLDVLPLLDNAWKNPERVQDSMLKALALDSENPLALSALGEARLQLDRPLEALECLSRAIRIKPDFSRAYHSRGITYLRLQLPAMAGSDFGEAVRLSPDNPDYWRDSATAWLIQEDLPAMCRAFAQACRLGDCSGYEWAVEKNKCQKEDF